MKEPQVTREVLKKKNLKKTPTSASKKSGSDVLSRAKKVTIKKATRNFTLAQLAETPNKLATVVKDPEIFNVPTAVAAVHTLQTDSVFTYTFITAIQVVGMGLALFGVCFAFVFGSGILPPHTQSAQVVEAVATATDTVITTTLHCNVGFVVVSNACVNPKPAVTFSVPGDHTNLHGTVAVQATVENATHVSLSVYSKDVSTSFPVGPMIKTGDKTYTFDWPTTAYHDGTYYLQATVENSYGSYDTGDTAHALIVMNTPPTVISTTTNPLPPPLASPTVTAPTISSDVTKSPSQFKFSIKVAGAQGVVLYAQLLPDGTPQPIGSAYQNNDSEWRFVWQLGTISNGQYRVTAQVKKTDTTTVETPSLILTKLSPATTTIVNASTTELKSTSTAAVAAVPTPLPNPVATALVSPASPVHGITQFKIQVPNAYAISAYLQNSNGLINTPIGKAVKVDTDVWTVTFDSVTVPDGNYTLVTTIANTYGTYENRPLTFSVTNRREPAPTPDQAKAISELNAVAKIAPTLAEMPTPSKDMPIKIDKTEPVSTSTVESVTQATDAAIASELDKLAVALRTGDTLKVTGIKANIQSLAKQSVYRATGSTDSNQLTTSLNKHIEDVIARTETNVVTIDKIIHDRTGVEASKDSDNDGIPDFDEVTIYHTNPFAADTDNDGFTDGAEIMSGHDPLSAKTEVLVSYESPKVSGVEQKSLLAVTSITKTTATTTEATTTPSSSNTTAIITGKAPANSYITLYIFSTPIIITIKTDSDGSWNYHFDKELENGTHEMYVGVTDNAGKIVAKSAPFTFIKTAEAYSGQKEITDAVAAPTIPVEHNLLSSTMLYILFGLSVLIIGLVLVLIGSQLDVRRHHIIASDVVQ